MEVNGAISAHCITPTSVRLYRAQVTFARPSRNSPIPHRLMPQRRHRLDKHPHPCSNSRPGYSAWPSLSYRSFRTSRHVPAGCLAAVVEPLDRRRSLRTRIRHRRPPRRHFQRDGQHFGLSTMNLGSRMHTKKDGRLCRFRRLYPIPPHHTRLNGTWKRSRSLSCRTTQRSHGGSTWRSIPIYGRAYRTTHFAHSYGTS